MFYIALGFFFISRKQNGNNIRTDLNMLLKSNPNYFLRNKEHRKINRRLSHARETTIISVRDLFRSELPLPFILTSFFFIQVMEIQRFPACTSTTLMGWTTTTSTTGTWLYLRFEIQNLAFI